MRGTAWQKTEPHFFGAGPECYSRTKGCHEDALHKSHRRARNQLDLKTLVTAFAGTNAVRRLFSNFWSALEHPQPGRQSAYRRLKERRNALTLGLAQLVLCPNNFFPPPFLFLLHHCLRHPHPSSISVPPEIKNTGANSDVYSQIAFHQYLCDSG